MCLIGITAGTALGADVINVDINGYNSQTLYIGNGAYDVGQVPWTIYYGSYGKAVGSAKTESLANSGQVNVSSTYSSQIWIGDNGDNHTYISGTGLMDDGFVANPGTEPNLALYGQGAYQGVYNIYVYGADAGSFTLCRYGVRTTKTVTGNVPAGQFVEGGNYVVFNNVDINSTNPSDIYLIYTNKLNALQFVRVKTIPSVQNGTLIQAAEYSVAGDRNGRETETTDYGPDIYPGDTIYPNGRVVGYLDTGEFMEYEFSVDNANKGRYDIQLGISGEAIRTGGMELYVDDKFIGAPGATKSVTTVVNTNPNIALANLTAGTHRVRWMVKQYNTGWAAAYVKFTRVGDLQIASCSDVQANNLALKGDFTGDCIVNMKDLKAFAANWLVKY